MTRTTVLSRRRFRWFPDSLIGQLVLALLLGILILQGTNFMVVCNVQALYVHQAEKTRAENLATYWFLFNSMTQEQRGEALRRMGDSQRPEKLREMVEILPEAPDWREATNKTDRLIRMVNDSLTPDSDGFPVVRARTHENGIGIFPVHLPVLETAVSLSDGTWLKVTQPLDVDDRYVVWSQRLFVMVESLVMIVLMVILLLRVTKPLRRLSSAAESFGKHPEMSAPLPERGAKEIRDAAQSFNRMRERICDNLAERDRMIAAMAHDLRTPLTKVQLRLDHVEPEGLREKLKATVSDIRSIMNQGLELAGSLTTKEAMIRLDIKTFLQSMVDDSVDVGRKVALSLPRKGENGPLIVNARPLCLKRCLENLISNACKYGDGAEVALTEEEDCNVVAVRDKGPGIPEEMLERVFEPYFRLETSRNRSLGGTGLGLSIARNMALLNNSDLELSNIPEGGLMVKVILPRL